MAHPSQSSTLDLIFDIQHIATLGIDINRSRTAAEPQYVTQAAGLECLEATDVRSRESPAFTAVKKRGDNNSLIYSQFCLDAYFLAASQRAP